MHSLHPPALAELGLQTFLRSLALHDLAAELCLQLSVRVAICDVASLHLGDLQAEARDLLRQPLDVVLELCVRGLGPLVRGVEGLDFVGVHDLAEQRFLHVGDLVLHRNELLRSIGQRVVVGHEPQPSLLDERDGLRAGRGTGRGTWGITRQAGGHHPRQRRRGRWTDQQRRRPIQHRRPSHQNQARTHAVPLHCPQKWHPRPRHVISCRGHTSAS
mmetsp:Transcript_118550/g.377904  ORF Transcript_118550/g.377904 Transcript_118550/m.377904 type:complete len:216 (+) Transcript_118550:1078-1725(+)